MNFRFKWLLPLLIVGITIAYFLNYNILFYVLIALLIVILIEAVLGAIFIENNYYVTSINSLENSSDKISHHNKDSLSICLTFDDGIDSVRTPKVLDILKQYDINAMFFIIGNTLHGNESILKRMHSEGHIIGNHSYSHDFWFDMKSSKAMLDDIERMNQVVYEQLGFRPKYFRPPYGVTNPNLAQAIKESGMQSLGWNLRSMDTVAKSKGQLLEKLKSKTKPNTILLLHDRCDVAVEVLADYIDFCKQKGYTFVTIKN